VEDGLSERTRGASGCAALRFGGRRRHGRCVRSTPASTFLMSTRRSRDKA